MSVIALLAFGVSAVVLIRETRVVEQSMGQQAKRGNNADNLLQVEEFVIGSGGVFLVSLGIVTFQTILLFAAHRRFELALAQSERIHRSLVEGQSELIVLAHRDGSLRYVNPAFARAFEPLGADIRKMSLLETIEPADRFRMKNAIDEVLTAADSVAVECRVRHSGPERWLSWRLQVQGSGAD
jgi:PAS domain S-box-containing protein